MKELNTHELMKLNGGWSLNGTLVSAFVKGLDLIMEIGRSYGSSLRRRISKNYCPIVN